MTLAEHQRAMRDLIQGRAVAPDPYVEMAGRSIGLDVTRDTIRGWRVFRLAQSCRLTTAALRDRGRLDEVLAVVERPPVSPFIEEMASAFLDAAATLGDEVVTSVAAFERALLRDEATETSVDWPCNPYDVLAPLLQGGPLPPLAYVPHRTLVSRSIPGRFRIVAI